MVFFQAGLIKEILYVTLPIDSFAEDFDPSFKIFHELMAKKVRDILLVSTPYDAWIMEEDCRLSERIIHEYRGLNLSNPPIPRLEPQQSAPLHLGCHGGRSAGRSG